MIIPGANPGVMMLGAKRLLAYPQFVSAVQTPTSNLFAGPTSTKTVTLPSGLVAGDFLIACVLVYNVGLIEETSGTWQLQGAADGGIYFFTKFYSPGDSNPTFHNTDEGNVRWFAQIAAYRGVNPDFTYEQGSIASGTGNVPGQAQPDGWAPQGDKRLAVFSGIAIDANYQVISQAPNIVDSGGRYTSRINNSVLDSSGSPTMYAVGSIMDFQAANGEAVSPPYVSNYDFTTSNEAGPTGAFSLILVPIGDDRIGP